MPEEEKSEEDSLFNEGIAKLKRIDKIRQRLQYGRDCGLKDLMISCLWDWRSELVGNNKKMTGEKKEKSRQLINNAKFQVDLLQGKIKNEKSFFIGSPIEGGSEGIMYESIDKAETYLCELQDEFGMGMPDKAKSSGAAKKV